MDWIWHALLGVEADADEEQDLAGGNSNATAAATPKFKSPPLHPAQKFRKLCQRIARNDASLKGLWLWDAAVITNDYPALINALSQNTHLERVQVELSHANPTTTCPPPQGSSSSSSPDMVQVLCRKGLCCLSNSLQHLSFSGTFLGGEQLVSLADCLERLSALRSLNLSNCKITDEAMDAWRKHLLVIKGRRKQQGCVTTNLLVEWNLDHNLLSDGTVLATVVNHTPCSLKILKLARNRLSDEDVCDMISSLDPKVIGSLQDLDLSYNTRIQATGRTLGRVLVSFPSMCRLVFDGNHSSKDTNTHNGLQWNDTTGIEIPATLKTLSLRGCHLSDADASSIARVFAASSTTTRIGDNDTNIPMLNQLHLSNNSISERGLVSLLEHSPLLTRNLSVSRNSVRCGQTLLSLLAKEGNHPTIGLKKLDLSHNRRLSPSERKEIEFWIQLNATGARHLLASCDDAAPLLLWSMVFGHAVGQADVLFYILSRKPELCIPR